ncbi:MAG TPA: hypothetical protein VGB92_07420 [Longimicrobium sp.]|jgi:hypothetical protein
MITPDVRFRSGRSDDSDHVRIEPDNPRRYPHRDGFERGVTLPGIEPTRAPAEKDEDPAWPAEENEPEF